MEKIEIFKTHDIKKETRCLIEVGTKQIKNMYNKFLKVSILIASVEIVFGSCSKKDDNGSSTNNATNGKTTAVFKSGVTYGTLTDQEGNVYKTVAIGSQIWMAENLRTTKYNDGTAIPNVTSASSWWFLSTGAYCNFNNTSNTDTIATYGRLYNWFAVNTGKLAPKGWHVPTDSEWTTLTAYLGGENVAGGKLKETGTTHWNSPNTGGTNETGFTALPGGNRDNDGTFEYIGNNGLWWSATEYFTNYALYWYISYNDIYVYSASNYLKEAGFSVRCVRD